MTDDQRKPSPEELKDAIAQIGKQQKKAHEILIKGDLNEDKFKTLITAVTEITIMKAQLQADIKPLWLMQK